MLPTCQKEREGNVAPSRRHLVRAHLRPASQPPTALQHPLSILIHSHLGQLNPA